MNRFQLLRFNCEPISIPANKLICVDAGNNIINVRYYDEDDNEQHAVGYSLVHHWR
jgi:hypothetical protein